MPISGAFGAGPPRIGGDPLSERFGVVTQMDGLESFDTELDDVRYETVDGRRLPVLPLHRILHSKRAAGRPKDLAAAHAIEEAILLLDHTK